MKRLKHYCFTGILFVSCFIFVCTPGSADDTCVFSTTADDVTPNIVILLDNGAEMEQVNWLSSYDNSVDYTPAVEVADRVDVVGNARVSGTLELDNIVGAFADNDALTGNQGGSATQNGALAGSSLSYDGQTTGYFVEGETVTSASGGTATIVSVSENCNGFFNDNGYAVVKFATSKYYIRPIESATLAPDPDDADGLFSTSNTFKINGREVTLPYLPSTSEVDGVIDNATRFRYSKNYLNWIFFDAAGTLELSGVSGTFTDNEALTSASGAATVDGTMNYFLHYDAETSDFTVGEFVTGGTSGATGTILTIDATDATSGKLELGGVTEGAGGAFQDNEALTGNNNGAASVNGTLTGALRYDAKTSSFAAGEVVSGASASGTIVANGITTTYTGDGSDLSTKSRFYYAKKAIMTTAKLTSNNANFAVFRFSNDDGAGNSVPIGPAVDTIAVDPANNVLDSDFTNRINNMGTIDYSPLAEGFQSVGYYYSSSAISQYVDFEYCQKHFALVVTPGVSSKDAGATASRVPETLSDAACVDTDNPCGDNDGYDAGADEGKIYEDATEYTIPTNVDGTTYLDDVAYYLYTHKVVGDTSNNGVWDGTSNVLTYTVGFMGNHESNLFLINTSNNGNGEKNLYNTSDPDYGKWHYEAEDPDDLATELLAAVNDILSRTSSFTAPVVPVTRTTSGNYIYMAFFTPSEGNFWEGNVTKFGLLSVGSTIKIVNKDGITEATYANGAMKENADPYWESKDWATPGESNYIHYENRNIYTYLGDTDVTDTSNAFNSTNITAAMLGNPTAVTVNGNAVSGVDKVIYYVRGADVFDEDSDGNTIGAVAGDDAENRAVITGDVLHSEPLVVYYNASTTMVYFGANDGMFHAVNDSDGTEAWAFIPTDLLPSLKNMIEGTSHQYYVDSSPKAYIYDKDGDGEIEPNAPDLDKVYLVCGEREGGTSYFILDVTDPDAPVYVGIVSQAQADFSELGETWSEPEFGLVKNGVVNTPVFFIGGGYSSDNTKGKAVFAVNVETGDLVKSFYHDDGVHTNHADMDYSIPSPVTVLDSNNNGFVDKIYVGDLGGQMWRFGNFAGSTFPNGDEDITTWTGQRLFVAPTYTVTEGEHPHEVDVTYTRKFFYPPAVTFEKGYHLVFAGTGDRESPCKETSLERIYCLKDTHSTDPEFDENYLVDVTETDPAEAAYNPPPDLNSATSDSDGNTIHDQGWYIKLATGEKALGESTVFYKTLYITTFTPNAALADSDPCTPGGLGMLYALNYLTGEAVLDFDDDADTERTVSIGGGIPSKPVMVITETGQKLFISVGSTNPDDSIEGEAFGAGIVAVDPLSPPANFFLLWWRELID